MQVYLPDMTSKEAGEALPKAKMAILPVGSTERHGPHLPLSVDYHTSHDFAIAAAVRASKEFEIEGVPASWWDSTPETASQELMDGHHVPGHADESETSLLLYLHPELVKRDEALGPSRSPKSMRTWAARSTGCARAWTRPPRKRVRRCSTKPSPG